MPARETTANSILIPERWKMSSIPLPRIRGYDIALQENPEVGSPALLFVVDGDYSPTACFSVALRIENGEVMNSDDLQKLRDLVNQASPVVSNWLPLGLVSARTKLAFEKAGPEKKTDAIVLREMEGLSCALNLTEPAIHDDGAFYAYFTLTIR